MQNSQSIFGQHDMQLRRDATMLGMEAPTLQVLLSLQEQLRAVRDELAEVRYAVEAISVDTQKDFYTTSEVAELMRVSRHHVTERWCNQARIECDKDPQSGQWRIPGHEYRRLAKGGKPLPLRNDRG